MHGFIEKKIAEAAARGEFDNLPNAGKPLDLAENLYLAPEWRLAFKILADNHVVPEFVERRRTIEQLQSRMRELSAETPKRPLAYRECLENLAAEIEALNRALVRENQFVRAGFQLPPVDVEAEMRAFTGDTAPRAD